MNFNLKENNNLKASEDVFLHKYDPIVLREAMEDPS